MSAGIRYYRARAPLRLSFCGGGTDVSPYPEEHGGCVLSATINHYAYASLRPRRDPRLTLASLDYDVVAKYEHARRVKIDGTLDLLKAAVRALRVRRGADLWTHSDAPPGSGLGASSTLMVALLAVLREWLKLDLSPYDLAELAYRVERVDLKLAGGRQDQYAASFGGFNYIEFDSGGRVIVIVAGLVIIGVGVAAIVKGVRKSFAEEIDTSPLSPTLRTAVARLGQVGYIAKGLALGVVGGLLSYATLTFDPQQVQGLDGAMHTILAQPFGRFLLTAVALGFAAFGLFAILQSRYRRM